MPGGVGISRSASNRDQGDKDVDGFLIGDDRTAATDRGLADRVATASLAAPCPCPDIYSDICSDICRASRKPGVHTAFGGRESRPLADRQGHAFARREDRSAARRDRRAHVDRGQGRPADPGRHRQHHPRGPAHLQARLDPQRGQFGAERRRSRAADRVAEARGCLLRCVDGAQRRSARHSGDLGHRRGARQQQHSRCDALPA